jgi:hypothetical protein
MPTARPRRNAPVQPDHGAGRAALRQSRLIQLIESKDTIQRYEKLVERIAKGTLDVPGFIKEVSLDAAVQVADMMYSGENDKVRLEAAKDILDRAGYNKTAKIAIAGHLNVDHDTSKLELVNLILSSARRAGLKVKDDDPVFETTPAPATIDVTPVAPLLGLEDDAEED